MGSSQDSLIVINWRTKTITEITLDGQTINSFTHEELKEPIDIALDEKDGNFLVADNGLGSLLVFEPSGKLLRTIGLKKKFKDLSAVCVAPTGQYIVSDASAIHVFTPEGQLVREIVPPVKGRFGGLACDKNGFLLATHTAKKQSAVLVFNLDSGELYSTIDSHGSKMKRPMGLAVLDGEKTIVVVDIGSNCIRKYRYF